MPLNKSKGQMYPWVTHTFNIIKGKCPHDCSYCYMKRYPQKELHFDGSELKTDLGSGNTIFVGSSCDMWADEISEDWIYTILHKCASHNNTYLFQTKNPLRFGSFWFPYKTILGITIETNLRYNISNAPATETRFVAFKSHPHYGKMVSIEPIIDFDLDVMVDWMREIKPQFVSIGADSGNNYLPEPSGDKVKALIEELKKSTEVKVKDNLKRLLTKPAEVKDGTA